MKIIITIDVDGENVKVSTDTEEPKRKTFEELLEDENKSNGSVSEYARFFDEGCVGWSKEPEYNLMFLRQQQNYCNDMLRVKGHLFLNDVYVMLGIPKSKAGQVVGWIYDESDPTLDNYVDFGLYRYDDAHADFINGYSNRILLDFNVDGNILDRI